MCVSLLDDADRQLLDENRVERDRIGEEIKELRERNVSILTNVRHLVHRVLNSCLMAVDQYNGLDLYIVFTASSNSTVYV